MPFSVLYCKFFHVIIVACFVPVAPLELLEAGAQCAPFKKWRAVPTLQMYLHLRNVAADKPPFSVIDIVYGKLVVQVVTEPHFNPGGGITPASPICEILY